MVFRIVHLTWTRFDPLSNPPVFTLLFIRENGRLRWKKLRIVWSNDRRTRVLVLQFCLVLRFTIRDMARGRGGYSGARGRPHANEGSSHRNRNDSNMSGDGMETSGANVNNANSSSQVNIGSLQDNSLREGRKELFVVNGFFDNSSECSRAITKIFKERIDVGAYTWTKISDSTKKFYFEEFKKEFFWDPENERAVKEAWDSKASLRYADLMRGLRNKGEKESFITDDAWNSFTTYWNTPKYKEKREINKQNVLKGQGASTHTGGSISYREHAKKLESILERPPTPFELFLHTCTKNHDKQTFVNVRSQEINDNMLRLRQAHEANPVTEEGESQPTNESALYYQAAGGNTKKRVYGGGSKACDFYVNSGANSNGTTSKQDEGWKEKYLTMKRKYMKLARKTTSIKQTLKIVCNRVGVPTLDLDSENEDSDQDESEGEAQQNPYASHCEEGASNGDDHHSAI